MKIKKNYVLQEIADEYFVVPIAEEADRLHGVIRLNETGALLWNHLEKGIQSKKELETIIISEYNVAQVNLRTDIDLFLNQLEAIGCLE